ncbi:MAG: hypothetical protein ACXVX9_12045 [Mycobacteriaceae bacterium]
MNTVGRRRVVLGGVLAVLGGVLLLRVVACGPTADAPGAGSGGTGPGDPPGAFTIDGNADETTSPGVMTRLDLTLRNPYDFPLWVTGLRLSVQALSAPNADDTHPCTVDDFTVDQASRGFTITLGARAASTLSSLGLPPAAWPQVGMLDRSVDQDGCKGASLTLGYTASGRPKK